jgi:hypothetical protein
VRFSSDAETLAAMVVTTRWLPELVRRVEAGVKSLGAKIEKKAMLRFGDDTVCPVLFLRGKRGWQLELRLRNAMEDFLLLDRDERPVRLDPRLMDAEFAAGKLADIVSARLAMVRALNESRRAGDVAKHLQKLGGKHGTFRVWQYGDGGRDDRAGG